MTLCGGEISSNFLAFSTNRVYINNIRDVCVSGDDQGLSTGHSLSLALWPDPQTLTTLTTPNRISLFASPRPCLTVKVQMSTWITRDSKAIRGALNLYELSSDKSGYQRLRKHRRRHFKGDKNQ